LKSSRSVANFAASWPDKDVKLLASKLIIAVVFFSALGSALLALQRGAFEGESPGPFPEGPARAEWTFARFHYPSTGTNPFRGFRGFQLWAADYPKADRQYVQGVRRLTRLDAKPVEQVVDADSDELYNWPWIYMEHGAGWDFSEVQAARLRQYLLRGGFLFSDDTHGDYEWEALARGMQSIFPDRSIEDLSDNDELFHTVYDLDARFQIRGTRFLWGGRTYSSDMTVAKWRGVRDERGRIMVAICHNSDVGDAWEWADSPDYPERETSLAYRIGINYTIYSLTH